MPDETVNYLASVAPRLGSGVAMAGPFAAHAGSAEAPDTGSTYTDDRDRAYAGGGIVSGGYATVSPSPEKDDPSARAFDGGGLVTTAAPTGVLTRQSFVPAAASPQVTPVAAIQAGGWGIQVGAFPNPAASTAAIEMARAQVADFLFGALPTIIPVQHGGILYRARLMDLSATSATAACARLAAQGVDCFAIPPGS